MNKSNLQSYFDYYFGLETPGFAVLVTGDWGSGKTFQVMNAIPDNLKCHVSLFGISDAQEVYSTVFAKMFPGRSLAKKLLDITKDMSGEINGFTFGAGSLAGNILSPLIKLAVDPAKIIIFDDLERCSMSNKEIFGVINHYIEHHQCKVIILAHDKETHNEFIKTKEKIIGHTIQIEPQTDEAAALFFSKNYKLNNFKVIKPIIIDTFKKTNCKSLRILKHVISDCNRLLECLEPSHLKNTVAMRALFNFFCIANIEYRLGNITTADIVDIPQNHLEFAGVMQRAEVNNNDENEQLNKKKSFYKKYDALDLRSDIIDYEVIASILETGDYPKEEIIKSLGLSKYFIQQRDNPPWLTIINFDSQESIVVSAAINEMFNNLNNLTITDIGEIIHSFCLSYFLSDQGEITTNFDDLFDLQTSYIDNLLQNDLLLPEPLIYDPFSDDIYERAYTHRYWIKDSYRSYADNIIDYIKKSRTMSKVKKYPVYAKEVLQALDTDVDHFKSLLIGRGADVGLYYYVDIMNSIDPDDFLIHWLMLPTELWIKVKLILTARYNGAAHNSLVKEKQWLQTLALNLLFEAKLHNGLDKARIERLVPYRALKSF